MTQLIQFAVLGLGAGAVYALLAQGIVLVYRASGVLNLAHGAMAMAGAFLFYELNQNSGIPYIPAFALTVLALGVVGALVYVLIIRPLRHASPLARVIATLGVLTILTSIATMRYEGQVFIVTERLPSGIITVGKVNVAEDRLWLLGIACAVTLVLFLFFRYTRAGLATLAVAESPRSAAAFGWSVDRVAMLAWAAGGASAGAAGVLIAPIVSIDVQSLTWLVIPALAAGLLAGFTSYPRALVGGLVIGVLQSWCTRWVTLQGASDVVPFAVIVVLLVVRGQSLNLRHHLVERLPELGSGVLRPRVIAVVLPLVIVAAGLLPQEWSVGLGISAASAIVLLSVVVVTGYAGQLSLGQYALAGLGALIAGRLVAMAHWGFVPSMLVAVASTTLIGVLFALPALRARGINLAIVTLGLGLAIQSAILTNTSYSGGISGFNVGSPTFFGFPIQPVNHPRDYTVFAVIALAIVAWVVGNVRRSRAGRRLIAVRTNERAAAALGVSVFQAKLYAFVLAASIAGFGGVVLAFGSPTVLVSSGFDPVASITAVSLVVVGGPGYILGALLGATLVVGGLPGGVIANSIHDGTNWLTLVGGVAVILILLKDANGMASDVIRTARKLFPERSTVAGPTLKLDATERRIAPAASLEVSGLTVRFGGVTAVNDVSLTVNTGEVVGLIGPNGAGKTTFVDAVTGFVRPSEGTIALTGTDISGWSAHTRARAGLTRSFQSLELFDDLTVLDNLRAASDPRDALGYLSGLVRPGAEYLSPEAQVAIRDFGLSDDVGVRASDLSYGKRRLVAIARAVAAAPSLLLLDEPAAGLSQTETEELGKLIRRLASEWGLGVLLIEHDVSVVMSTCDRVAVLDFGRKIADDVPDAVRADEVVRAAYLGGATVATDDTQLVATVESGR